MATWDELTDEQRGVLAEYTRQLRAATGQMARVAGKALVVAITLRS